LYATALIGAGEDVKTVQAGLGHAIAVETWEMYAGLWLDNEQRTRAPVHGLSLSSKVQHR
jgi:site-specific recombinase XerD